VPLATAHACVEALGIAERALPMVEPSLRCDVEAAVLLLSACVDAVLLNVEADMDELDARRGPMCCPRVIACGSNRLNSAIV